MLERLVFYGLAGIVLGSAAGVVLMRSVFHSALLLGLCLAAVGGIFATLGADFLFVSQILIYVGGIAVLILFVVLLSGRASDLARPQVNEQWMAALLICGVTFWGLWKIFGPHQAVRALGPAGPTTHELGRILLGSYAVPFELVSLILLAALVGAVVFTKSEP